jgi:hypothetical protein
MTALAALLAVCLMQPPPSPGQPPLEKPAKPSPGSPEKTPRKPSPFAPSLPDLTDAEEEVLDRLIDRFIEADIGKLVGPDAKKAVAEFQALGPEATFALIRGLNKAAAINHSCPAVTIAKKLSGTLRTTRDKQLLEFARENIGSGVESSRHMAVLKDLKVTASLRKSAIEREPTPEIRGPGP